MCGICGISGGEEAANLVYLGLYALQHRGQESTGIAALEGDRVRLERGMGHVADVFSASVLSRLKGTTALGHTRYSTSGASQLDNAQPIAVRTSMGPLVLVHNGNLTNALRLRRELESSGSIFQTTSDSEVILHLMARNPRPDPLDSLVEALSRVEGAYSLLLAGPGFLVAARDIYGFRPLVRGHLGAAVAYASETCAFDLLGIAFEGEVQPGTLEVVREGKLERIELRDRVHTAPRRCAFEHVYFARPDSVVFGESVAAVRERLGARLAQEQPADADMVVPVPDSGLYAALGYSRSSGLPFVLGMTRNHYVGRTFIEPRQSIRNFGVKVKLNPVRAAIAGKRVALVDDSIVRGTTSRKLVQMVREAGARQVHLRISSPPTRWPCYFGIDTPRRAELIAAQQSIEEIAQFVGADSLGYLSLEGMVGCLSGSPESYCLACWSGEYPASVRGEDQRQVELFPVALEEDDS